MVRELLGSASEVLAVGPEDETAIAIVGIIAGVVIVAAIVAGVVAVARIVVRHRERLALIGMGINPDDPLDVQSRLSNVDSTRANSVCG